MEKDTEAKAIAERIEQIRTLHKEHFSSGEEKEILAGIVSENLGMKNYTKSNDLKKLEKTIAALEDYLSE